MNLIDKWVAMRAVQGIDSVATLRDGDPVIRMSAVEHVLENLPETEPDTTTHDSIPAETDENDNDGTSGDCVSRQQAIDALCKSECGWNNAECRHKDGTDFYVTCDNVKIIKSLPSAQPEIIRCKDCKYYKYGICMKIGANKSFYGFCDWAERGEQNG